MAMPETPIDENRCAALGNKDVGFTRKIRRVQPNPKTVLAEESSDSFLWSRVRAPDARHDLAPLHF